MMTRPGRRRAPVGSDASRDAAPDACKTPGTDADELPPGPPDQRFTSCSPTRPPSRPKGSGSRVGAARYVDPSAAADAARPGDRGDDINHEVLQHLEATFVTPVGRHEVHDLTGVSATSSISRRRSRHARALPTCRYRIRCGGAGDDRAQACDVIVEAVGSLMHPVELRALAPRKRCAREDGDRLRRRSSSGCASRRRVRSPC